MTPVLTGAQFNKANLHNSLCELVKDLMLVSVK